MSRNQRLRHRDGDIRYEFQLSFISILLTSLGGTMAGIGTYLKDNKPSVYVVAVCTAAGDRVPGPRAKALLSPMFPWSKCVDTVEEVASPISFKNSLELSREGIICGPSSGLNLQGLFNMLEKRKTAGTLSELAGEDGEIHCVFLCCDLPYQYIDEYYDKLGQENFHPIQNQVSPTQKGTSMPWSVFNPLDRTSTKWTYTATT
jgi:hypothetical protein